MDMPLEQNSELISSEELVAYEAGMEAYLNACRKDVNTFCEYVIKDEETGRSIVQAPLHEEWHEMLSKNDKVLIWSCIETGKTMQLSIARVLWELGNDPSMRFVIVSNTHGQSVKIVRTIAKYIEQSEELHRVFPNLEPGDSWSGGYLVVKRPIVSKDPSVQSTGVHGNILGARIDRLILDDMLDYENCRTDYLRQELWDWYHATLAGRLTARSRICCVGTSYHPDDLLHRFSQTSSWKAKKFPIFDESGIPRWPERWPIARLARKREELGPSEFARQCLCQARDDTVSRFKKEWIDFCMKRGQGIKMQPSISELPSGVSTYTGVDLAVQRTAKSDRTVLFTIAVHPDGTREVVWIESGKWQGPEIVARIIDTHRRYHSIIWVEGNAAQSFIAQFAVGASAVPIRNFTTTAKNKYSPAFGVESLATEMSNGKWIIPCGEHDELDPEISAWITEMLYYDPMAHMGDRLAACWFAREAARQGSQAVESFQLDLTRR